MKNCTNDCEVSLSRQSVNPIVTATEMTPIMIVDEVDKVTFHFQMLIVDYHVLIVPIVLLVDHVQR